MRKVLFLLIAGLLICAPSTTVSADCGLCGDLNGDGNIDIADLTAFITWYTPPFTDTPECPGDADMDCNGSVQFGVNPDDDFQTDLEILIDYLFNNGPAPCDPTAFPNCS